MIQNVVVLIAASGGVILMLGALVLLYQGRIALQAIQEKVQEKGQQKEVGGDALAVEIGQIKIKSQYPTIALFLVAAGCFWLALEYGKGPKRTISGTLEDAQAKDYTVTYNGLMGVVFPDDKGHFEQDVPEDVNLVVLEIGKGGLDPQKFPVYPGKVKEWPVKCRLKAAPGDSASSPARKLEIDPSQITQVDKALPALKAP
jgi:hypothetical protein